MNKQKKRQSVIGEVEALMETYCHECPVKQQLRLEKGKNQAHRFCIKGCTVGAQLQQLGEKLT